MFDDVIFDSAMFDAGSATVLGRRDAGGFFRDLEGAAFVIYKVLRGWF